MKRYLIFGAICPLIGGFLIDHGSWRYAFFLNVPLALAAIILTFRYIPESRSRPRSERIDWLSLIRTTLMNRGAS